MLIHAVCVKRFLSFFAEIDVLRFMPCLIFGLAIRQSFRDKFLDATFLPGNVFLLPLSVHRPAVGGYACHFLLQPFHTLFQRESHTYLYQSRLRR